MVDITKPLRARIYDADASWHDSNCLDVDVEMIVLPHHPYAKQMEIIYNGGRSKAFEFLTQSALTLEELKAMEGEPIWIEVLDRTDLSRWHFIVKTESLGLIAKDGLGQYECYPHNEKQLTFNGCYFDIEHGHNYGINWLAYRHKLIR